MKLNLYENITIDELPEILTAKHISAHLHLSKVRVYELFQLAHSAGGIESFGVGRSKRVMKEDYLNWLSVRRNSAS